MSRLCLTAVALAAFACGPARAQTPVFNWSGFYVGVHGGYGWGDADFRFPEDANFDVDFSPPSDVGFGRRIKGGLIGGHVGFNRQFGSVVVGLEGSLTWSGVEGLTVGAFPLLPDVSYDARVEWLGTITPRVGYAWNNWLFYGKGGIAFGRVRSELTAPFPGIPSNVFTETTDHLGWTLGLGVEYAWSPNWIIGLEYTYINLGSEQYGGRPFRAGAPTDGGYYFLDISQSSVLARLSYRPGAMMAQPGITAANHSPWTGFYIGIHGGYGWGDASTLFPGEGETTFGGVFAPLSLAGHGGSFGQNPTGALLGGHMGYNQMIGPLVLGLEGSLAWSGVSNRAVDPFFPAVDPMATYDLHLEWLATVTPRIGFAFGPWHVYGKGGIAAGRVNSELWSSAPPGALAHFQETNDHIGWTLGAGIEYAFAPSWILGVEYNFTDLGTQKYGGTGRVGPGWLTGEYHVDLKFSSVLARVSYRFGTP